MTAGLRIRTLLETLAKDSTWYFIAIFTSHIAFEATLIFGRVSAIVPYSVAMFPNVRPFRKQSSSFRACKLLSTCLDNNRPHHVVRRHNQRQCLVSPAFGAHYVIQTADGLFQVYPCDDLTDSYLVTESHRFAAEWLVLWGSSWRAYER